MIPVAQLGWMAGVLDLRGRIVYKKNRARVTPQVCLYLETKERFIYKELGRMTGLAPDVTRQAGFREGWDRRGCSEHCPDQHLHVETFRMPDTGRWTITGLAMGVVLDNLEPFLRNEERGFMEAKEMVFGQGVVKGRGSGATLAALTRLQALGWDIPAEVYQKMVVAEGEAA